MKKFIVVFILLIILSIVIVKKCVLINEVQKVAGHWREDPIHTVGRDSVVGELTEIGINSSSTYFTESVILERISQFDTINDAQLDTGLIATIRDPERDTILFRRKIFYLPIFRRGNLRYEGRARIVLMSDSATGLYNFESKRSFNLNEDPIMKYKMDGEFLMVKYPNLEKWMRYRRFFK